MRGRREEGGPKVQKLTRSVRGCVLLQDPAGPPSAARRESQEGGGIGRRFVAETRFRRGKLGGEQNLGLVTFSMLLEPCEFLTSQCGTRPALGFCQSRDILSQSSASAKQFHR